MRTRILGGARGLTLLEVMVALSVLVIGVVGVMQMNFMTTVQVSQTRQRSIARLAAISVREILEAQQFRKLPSSNTLWFMNGTAGPNFALASNVAGGPFLFPNISAMSLASSTYTFTGGVPNTTMAAQTSTTAAGSTGLAYSCTVDGIAKCIVVEFPVPPLQPIARRNFAGMVVFYLSERDQPTMTANSATGTSAFPFAPTQGLTYLDCDACGLAKASTTQDLRTNAVGTSPWMIQLPVQIRIDWKSTDRATSTESYQNFFLLNYRGFG